MIKGLTHVLHVIWCADLSCLAERFAVEVEDEASPLPRVTPLFFRKVAKLQKRRELHFSAVPRVGKPQKTQGLDACAHFHLFGMSKN
jgi:hypothetical protein